MKANIYKDDLTGRIWRATGVFIGALIIALLYIWNFYPQSGIVDAYSDSLYHAQWSEAIVSGGDYPSKIKTYPIFFLITGLLGKLISDYHIGITITAVLFGVGTYLIQYFFFTSKLKKFGVSYFKILFYSFGLSFVWPVDLTFGLLNKSLSLTGLYLKSFSTQPAHNLTSLAVKACSLYTVVFFLELFKEKHYKKKMVWLSILLLLTVLLKPSFYQYFAPCGALFTCIYLLRSISLERFRFCVGMAFSFIPATAWVLYGMSNNVNSFEFQPFTCILINNSNAFECILSVV